MSQRLFSFHDSADIYWYRTHHKNKKKNNNKKKNKNKNKNETERNGTAHLNCLFLNI